MSHRRSGIASDMIESRIGDNFAGTQTAQEAAMRIAFVISLFLASINFARAQQITDATSCAAAVSAIDSNNADAVRKISDLIVQDLATIDRSHVTKGEPSQLKSKNDQDGLFGNVMAFCRADPENSVQEEAVAAYNGARGLRNFWGTAK
jgi:hypothetical protein